jgi:hypothetical protein
MTTGRHSWGSEIADVDALAQGSDMRCMREVVA